MLSLALNYALHRDRLKMKHCEFMSIGSIQPESSQQRKEVEKKSKKEKFLQKS